MSLFVISLHYVKDLSAIDQLIEAHKMFLQEHYQKEVFLLSGRKEPRTGGIILARAKSKKEVMDIIAKDPFYLNKAAEYSVDEFMPSMASKELGFLVS